MTKICRDSRYSRDGLGAVLRETISFVCIEQLAHSRTAGTIAGLNCPIMKRGHLPVSSHTCLPVDVNHCIVVLVNLLGLENSMWCESTGQPTLPRLANLTVVTYNITK